MFVVLPAVIPLALSLLAAAGIGVPLLPLAQLGTARTLRGTPENLVGAGGRAWVWLLGGISRLLLPAATGDAGDSRTQDVLLSGVVGLGKVEPGALSGVPANPQFALLFCDLVFSVLGIL